MPLLRPVAWPLLALLALGGIASAEDVPLDLNSPPTPPAKPAKLLPPKETPTKDSGAKDSGAKDTGAKDTGAKDPGAKDGAAKAAVKPDISPADAVARANAFLDGARVLSADFVQIGPDGQRSEGELYVERPGKMLFRFSPPARLEIVADGRSVAVRDQKLETQDLYFIAQTPLKFLLADHIDIAKDTTVKRVAVEATAVTIEIEDKATFGGTAEIALVFDPSSFALKQWTVLDPQGFQTVVTLFNVDLTTKPDPQLFYINNSPSSPMNRK